MTTQRELLKIGFLETISNLIDILRPISKKMMEHHTVSSKPIRDLKNLIEIEEFKEALAICDTESKSRTIRLLSKKTKPILSFQSGIFKEEKFNISPLGISFQEDFVEYPKLIESIDKLIHYQDTMHFRDEVEPEFNDKHRYYYLLVNNVRLSIIDLTEQLERVIEKESKPRRLILRRKG